MTIFNSYVKLPEGRWYKRPHTLALAARGAGKGWRCGRIGPGVWISWWELAPNGGSGQKDPWRCRGKNICCRDLEKPCRCTLYIYYTYIMYIIIICISSSSLIYYIYMCFGLYLGYWWVKTVDVLERLNQYYVLLQSETLHPGSIYQIHPPLCESSEDLNPRIIGTTERNTTLSVYPYLYIYIHITLHYITLHYTTLHYIHYIIYITLHYIHTDTHTHHTTPHHTIPHHTIHTYIYIWYVHNVRSKL